jgi:MoxR-like ATPase
VFAAVESVYIDPLLKRWTIELVRATRTLEIVDVGASVRGSLALERLARAWALVNRRDFVVAEDVEGLFWAALGHRLILSPDVLMDASRDEQSIRAEVLDLCLAAAPRPEPDWEAETASSDA